jgi:threonine/homoserine/homoserine lactone efflux protein
VADGDNHAKPRRGPAWAYIVGGLLGFPFVTGFALGLFHLHLTDSGVTPITVAIAGAALGWLAYRAFSKPRATAGRPSDGV